MPKGVEHVEYLVMDIVPGNRRDIIGIIIVFWKKSASPCKKNLDKAISFLLYK